ncbi:MAG: putative flagellar assembly protein FliH [Pseudomonadota bacterium]|jgi:flagellar assembly protein FliH
MTIQKFLFDHSFDSGRSPLRPMEIEPEPEESLPPPPPPEPTFTLTELREQLAAVEAATRAQAYAEGQAAGKQAAETTDQRALATALDSVGQALGALLAGEQAAYRARSQHAVRLALAVVRKLFPTYAAAHGAAEVQATITHFLSELVEEQKLVIRVHESRYDLLAPRILEMARRQGFGGDVTLLSDPRLGPLDVRADWGDGGAERDVHAIWRDVERIAGDLLADLPGGPPAAAAVSRPSLM